MYTELLLKEQEGKFQSQLKALPNEALVECFNKQVRCLGGNTIRKIFLGALRNEFLNRDFDCSIVLNKYGFKLNQKVLLENNRLVYFRND